MREAKHYGLISTRRPARNEHLATAATVVDEDGTPGYAYISFSASFIEAVGKALPRGIHPSDPAHIHVAYDARRKVWAIHARYLAGDTVTELWTTEDKPKWLVIIKAAKGKRGNRTNPPNPA